MLDSDQPIWKKVLIERYGTGIGCIETVEVETWSRHTSTWWKDIMTIEEVVGEPWFKRELTRKVGNGRNTRFWYDVWRGNTLLHSQFPSIFAIQIYKRQKSLICGPFL